MRLYFIGGASGSGKTAATPYGKGITYDCKPTIPGNSYLLDDNLVLWLIKELGQK